MNKTKLTILALSVAALFFNAAHAGPPEEIQANASHQVFEENDASKKLFKSIRAELNGKYGCGCTDDLKVGCQCSDSCKSGIREAIKSKASAVTKAYDAAFSAFTVDVLPDFLKLAQSCPPDFPFRLKCLSKAAQSLPTLVGKGSFLDANLMSACPPAKGSSDAYDKDCMPKAVAALQRQISNSVAALNRASEIMGWASYVVGARGCTIPSAFDILMTDLRPVPPGRDGTLAGDMQAQAKRIAQASAPKAKAKAKSPGASKSGTANAGGSGSAGAGAASLAQGAGGPGGTGGNGPGAGKFGKGKGGGGTEEKSTGNLSVHHGVTGLPKCAATEEVALKLEIPRCSADMKLCTSDPDRKTDEVPLCTAKNLDPSKGACTKNLAKVSQNLPICRVEKVPLTPQGPVGGHDEKSGGPLSMGGQGLGKLGTGKGAGNREDGHLGAQGGEGDSLDPGARWWGSRFGGTPEKGPDRGLHYDQVEQSERVNPYFGELKCSELIKGSSYCFKNGGRYDPTQNASIKDPANMRQLLARDPVQAGPVMSDQNAAELKKLLDNHFDIAGKDTVRSDLFGWGAERLIETYLSRLVEGGGEIDEGVANEVQAAASCVSPVNAKSAEKILGMLKVAHSVATPKGLSELKATRTQNMLRAAQCMSVLQANQEKLRHEFAEDVKITSPLFTEEQLDRYFKLNNVLLSLGRPDSNVVVKYGLNAAQGAVNTAGMFAKAFTADLPVIHKMLTEAEYFGGMSEALDRLCAYSEFGDSGVAAQCRGKARDLILIKAMQNGLTGQFEELNQVVEVDGKPVKAFDYVAREGLRADLEAKGVKLAKGGAESIIQDPKHMLAVCGDYIKAVTQSDSNQPNPADPLRFNNSNALAALERLKAKTNYEIIRAPLRPIQTLMGRFCDKDFQQHLADSIGTNDSILSDYLSCGHVVFGNLGASLASAGIPESAEFKAMSKGWGDPDSGENKIACQDVRASVPMLCRYNAGVDEKKLRDDFIQHLPGVGMDLFAAFTLSAPKWGGWKNAPRNAAHGAAFGTGMGLVQTGVSYLTGHDLAEMKDLTNISASLCTAGYGGDSGECRGAFHEAIQAAKYDPSLKDSLVGVFTGKVSLKEFKDRVASDPDLKQLVHSAVDGAAWGLFGGEHGEDIRGKEVEYRDFIDKSADRLEKLTRLEENLQRKVSEGKTSLEPALKSVRAEIEGLSKALYPDGNAPEAKKLLADLRKESEKLLADFEQRDRDARAHEAALAAKGKADGAAKNRPGGEDRAPASVEVDRRGELRVSGNDGQVVRIPANAKTFLSPEISPAALSVGVADVPGFVEGAKASARKAGIEVETGDGVEAKLAEHFDSSGKRDSAYFDPADGRIYLDPATATVGDFLNAREDARLWKDSQSRAESLSSKLRGKEHTAGIADDFRAAHKSLGMLDDALRGGKLDQAESAVRVASEKITALRESLADLSKSKKPKDKALAAELERGVSDLEARLDRAEALRAEVANHQQEQIAYITDFSDPASPLKDEYDTLVRLYPDEAGDVAEIIARVAKEEGYDPKKGSDVSALKRVKDRIAELFKEAGCSIGG